MVELWPNLVQIKEARRLPNGGYYSKWVYKIGGVRFEGENETIEWIANQRIVGKSKGPVNLEAILIWVFEIDGEQTRVIFEGEYRLPLFLSESPVLGLLYARNQTDVDSMLTTLKDMMER